MARNIGEGQVSEQVEEGYACKTNYYNINTCGSHYFRNICVTQIQVTLYNFEKANPVCWFDTFVYYGIIAKVALANIFTMSHNYHFLFVLSRVTI